MFGRKAPGSESSGRHRVGYWAAFSAGCLVVGLGCGARSELDGGGLLASVDDTPESADHANGSVGTDNLGSGGDNPARLVDTASQGDRGRGEPDASGSNTGPGNSLGPPNRGGASNAGAGASNAGPGNSLGPPNRGGASNAGAGASNAGAGASNAGAGASNAGASSSGGEGNGGSDGMAGGRSVDGAGEREPDVEASDDLVGLWRFDEGEGSVVHDESGWQNHGTQEGGQWGSGELLTPALVDVPDHESLWLTESFTLEASVRVDSYGGGHGMIIFRGDSRAGLDPYVLSTEPNDTIQCMVSDDESAPAVLTAPGERAKMCVICTLDAASSQMRLYIDGALAAETTTTVRSLGPLAQMEAPGVSFGAHARRSSSSYPLDGALAEVRILRRALTADEVAARCEQLLSE